MADLKVNIISDPMKKLRIYDDNALSLIEMYVFRRDLYNELCMQQNMYNLCVAVEIKEFFRTTPKPSPKKSINNKTKYYVGKWMVYQNSQKKKIARLKAWDEQLRGLVKSTSEGECIWEEKVSSMLSSTVRKKKYVTLYKDVKFYMEVVSYKNREDEWKANLELQREGTDGQLKVCPGDYNVTLYNLLRKTAVVHKKENVSYVKKRALGETKKEIVINHGDFVVRTNLFRCFYKEHLVEEIIGVLKIVTPLGKEILEKIPCAYCPECNCFYMLTSEYNRVSEKGILLCQLLDKEDYYKTGIPNKFSGASESLLMQNGYNVKANVGLTDIQRQIILRNIIDSGILVPHRIASYLDTFIAQKKNLPQYKEAVLKWQRDKQYVLAYSEEDKRRVSIESIKR